MITLNITDDGNIFWHKIMHDTSNPPWRPSAVLHNVNGPAAEWADGGYEWAVNGNYHRLNGPAIEYSNDQVFWFINGKLHRLDGPAYEDSAGINEWHINGKEYNTELEYWIAVQNYDKSKNI